MILDTKKFIKKIKEKNQISEEDIEVRKLLQLCAECNLYNLQDIEKISFHTMRVAYQLLLNVDTSSDASNSSSALLKDMSNAEYAKDYIKSIEPIISEDTEDDPYV